MDREWERGYGNYVQYYIYGHALEPEKSPPPPARGCVILRRRKDE
jgi:hypothetical protein